ncbi:transcriptional regulator [Bacillus glycinifermentans]|uniref:Response regulator transcription factor n=1 Tax=Bacillus glycinifermentans TaxID=1664069 RepID=A0A0J6HK18_9BACI|nr:response regulator transcription factor [Bacillus glycinifermentans]ATH93771.1 DNA-binding response regulator [Bacillus glycinifermentans]KMM59532.1 transcriptional regulator [Bacillus glycinifermentans]KRT90052.1 two-component system response regulator [Bacillus glycinifermentans]MEC0483734.1 response regulator transcription factor [Bacillus glycinifermentans]MEC0496229.1 response regulator transcription factor [Bacillus glycinifermentans]
MDHSFGQFKVLIVDDDQHILNLLNVVFENEGFSHVLHAENGEEAFYLLKQEQPDIVLLDVMLPDTDGFALCNQFRQFTNIPVLFLTAKTSDLDKLQGFSFGGDDYITKPFNPLEVVARVKAQLKRSKGAAPSPSKPSYDFGDFQVNETSGKLVVDGRKVECPAQEFKLLLYFCSQPNQILSKQKIYRDVWGEFYNGDSTVMVHVRRLREKIEKDPGRPKWIKTARGLGYIFEVQQTGETQ